MIMTRMIDDDDDYDNDNDDDDDDIFVIHCSSSNVSDWRFAFASLRNVTCEYLLVVAGCRQLKRTCLHCLLMSSKRALLF
jgi:hypothetical protein